MSLRLYICFIKPEESSKDNKVAELHLLLLFSPGFQLQSKNITFYETFMLLSYDRGANDATQRDIDVAKLYFYNFFTQTQLFH